MDVEHHTSEMDGLRVQDPTEQQNGPHMQWKNAASRWIRRCWSCKLELYLAISIIIYIVLGVKIVEMGRNDARKRCGSCFSCHPGWLLNGTVCYYISIEERNWTSSKNFCSLHGASLARIENEEKDFVMQYKKKEPYWIGLTRHSGQAWKWLNGDLAT